MSKEPKRTLAVAPVPRGLGVCVLDSAKTLVRSCVREVRGKLGRKNAMALEELRKLIEKQRPHVLVLEHHVGSRYPKRGRIADLLVLMEEYAIESGLEVAKYGREEVRVALGLPEKANKDTVAKRVAELVPILKRQVPNKRWDAERYAMSIFVAAGLALTHLSRAQRRVRER